MPEGYDRQVRPPIVGYRAWLGDREGRLRSLSMPVWWEPGTQPAAKCHKLVHRFDETDPGPAPHPASHPCGYHAYDTLESLLAHGAADAGREPFLPVIRGIVEGGGRTQEHALGWRAQYVLPVAIIRFAPDDPELRSQVLLAQYAASERYDIPLIDPKDA